MAVPVVLRCGGLMTDPNPRMTAELGGLRQALNVVIEREGVASQRPGLGLQSSKSSSQRPRRIHLYRDTTPIVASWDGGIGTTWSIDTSAATITGTAEPLDYTQSFVQFAEARKNLYWTSKDGPYKITATNDTAGELAGLHEAPSGQVAALATGTPAVFPTDSAWAYRWCFTRLDANGLLVRSAPSPWQSTSNSSGSLRDGYLRIVLPTYVIAGDTVEIYRTKYVSPASATPSDQMYLVKKYRITSTDVTNTYAEPEDRVLEAKLGAELYTSPTREGLNKSNNRPLASQAIALWSTCLWLGCIKGPWTTVLELLNSAGSARTIGDLGYVNKTSATTNGSAVVTVASTAELSVGMLITDGSVPGTTTGTIAIGSFIQSIDSGTDLTMTKNATATSAAISLRYHDKITIGSENYYAAAVSSFSGRGATDYPAFAASATETLAVREIAAVISAHSSSYFAQAVEDPASERIVTGGAFTYVSRVSSLVIRRVSLSGATFVTSTTNDTAFNFQTAAGSTAPLNERDDFPNRLFYSKPDEPEHFPAINFVEVGSAIHAILALVPLRAALLVFKQDGLYRVTGSAPDGWRVDLLDARQSLIRAECVSSDGTYAYAWTPQGVVEVDEGGARSISEGKIGRELQPRLDHFVVSPLTTGYWVCVSPRRDCVMVGAPTGNGSEYAQAIYVFNRATSAWTKWDFTAYAATGSTSVNSSFGAAFIMARGGDFWELRTPVFYDPAATSYTGYDRSYTIAAWTVNGTTITVTDANRGDWIPKAGDWISGTVSGSLEFRLVTAAVDTGTAYDLTIASAFSATPSANRVGYEGIISKLQWQAVNPVPTRTRFMNRIHVLLDVLSLNSTYTGTTLRWLVGGQTDVTSTLATQESTGETRATKLFDLVVGPPRNIARASAHLPYVESCDIGVEWRCNGIGLDFVEESGSERVNR